MLCGPHEDATRNKAKEILRSVEGNSEISKSVDRVISPRGFLRAIVTAQREPIANTITRALYNGSSTFWTMLSEENLSPFMTLMAFIIA